MTSEDRLQHKGDGSEVQQIQTPWGTLRHVSQDGVIVWKLRCPQCGHEGQIDDDQLHGRVSLDHTNCGFAYAPSECQCTWHETHDYWPYIRERAEFLARLSQRVNEGASLLTRIAEGPLPGEPDISKATPVVPMPMPPDTTPHWRAPR